MSALATILSKRGYSVSGSDSKKNIAISNLEKEGIKIFSGQNASNIQTICNSKILPLIVSSTAIPPNNLELKAAQKEKLEIWHRSDLLAYLIQKQPSIAIAGSHGKTTTSTMITTLLAMANEDPTAIIGGYIPYYRSNGHAGSGKLLIAEADESDGTLVKFQAKLGLITNLELDHTDHYCNLEEVIQAMQTFGKGCKSLLANYDCPTIRQNLKASAWWSIKTKKGVEFAALPVSIDGKETIAEIYEKGEFLGEIKLSMPGLHNLSNAIAAIGACRLEGFSFGELQNLIPQLQAPKRRFDYRGEWNERLIVDDYAHHPSEVRATVEMARLMIKTGRSPLPRPPKRLVVVFQPHRFSRTQEFLHDFASALGGADSVLLAPVYGAGEMAIEGATSQALAESIKKTHSKIFIGVAKNFKEIEVLLTEKTNRNDLIIAMGAGDINTLFDQLQLKKK